MIYLITLYLIGRYNLEVYMLLPALIDAAGICATAWFFHFFIPYCGG
jgi:hypothetical protein